MIQPYRSQFNRQFSLAGYEQLRLELNKKTHSKIDFAVCETPCFFSRALLEEVAITGSELTHQLLGRPDYLSAAEDAVPPDYRVPGKSPHPNFMTVDFGFVRGSDGGLRPRLVEMQAFPSVFGYQDILAQQYIETFKLRSDLQWLLGGHDQDSYWSLLRRVIIGDHNPENVVLTEVEPDSQKTLPDFRVYEDKLKLTTVDIAKLRKERDRLFYKREGRWVPIYRIFNRAIVDEMQQKGTKLAFDFRDDLDVEWAGHPSWYFKISKFSLPYLDHPVVPKALFLEEWFNKDGRRKLTQEREMLLLKPLYSFAGKGIRFAPTDAELNSIPERERSMYLMQERVNFEPIIQTPYGLTQAEIRIMYLWPDDGELSPVISLVRLGRGLMMGVDHNRNQHWVGGSAALFPAS